MGCCTDGATALFFFVPDRQSRRGPLDFLRIHFSFSGLWVRNNAAKNVSFQDLIPTFFPITLESWKGVIILIIRKGI
jgi:hypothetical protein